MHNACILKLDPGYSGPLFHYFENRGTYTTFAGGTIAHCRYLDIYISRKIMLCVAKMFFKPVYGKVRYMDLRPATATYSVNGNLGRKSPFGF